MERGDFGASPFRRDTGQINSARYDHLIRRKRGSGKTPRLTQSTSRPFHPINIYPKLFGFSNLSRRRFRSKLPLLLVVVVTLALMAAYWFGVAWWQSRVFAHYEFNELLVPRLVDLTILSWLLYFTGAIGSFLNVVAWRMPRGESINGRSKCPRCANLLLARDNVPVLGWISLAGRCRFCSLPISRRYPIVEAAVAISLTAVGITQLYSLSLPYQPMHWHGGPLWSPLVTGSVLIVLVYHALMLSISWALALIRGDGVALPRSLVVFTLVVACLPMVAMPLLMVTPWQLERPEGWIAGNASAGQTTMHVDAVMRVISGLVAAAFFSRVLARTLCPAADPKLDPLGRDTGRLIDLMVILAVPSIVVGWQSVAAIVLMASVIAVLIRPFLTWLPINDGPNGSITRRDAMCRFSFSIPIAMTIHLVLWRHFVATPIWPSEGSSPQVIVIASVLVLLVPFWLRDETVEATDEPIDEDTGLDGTQADEDQQ